MSESIKNLIEVIERESCFQKAIKARIKSIKEFTFLGPPDFCYLTKEYQKSIKLFSKTEKIGYYHYFLGYDLSTPASASAYLKRLLQLQEKEKTWFSNGKWKISNCYFCIYDAYSKIDIHIEIALPGGMKLFGYKSNESMISIDDKIWERGYISSILRFMMLEKCSVLKIYKMFERKESLSLCLDTIYRFIVKNPGICNNIKTKNESNIEFYDNKTIFIISNFLLRKKKFSNLTGFLEKLIEFDKKNMIFYSNVLEFQSRVPEALASLATILSKFPHTIVLLYKQAILLLKLQKYDEALILSKIVIQLFPDSFDAWLLLSKIYLKKKNYEMCLISLNLAPTSQKINNNLHLESNTSLEITNPDEKTESSIFEFNFEISKTKLKFSRFNDEVIMANQDFQEENEKLQSHLEGLSGHKLEDQELQLYLIMVQIEKDITWDKLLKLRGVVFLMENDNANEILGNDQMNRIYNYEIYIENEEKMLYKGLKEENIEDEAQKIAKKLEGFEKSDSSDEEHELPSFLKGEEDNDEQLRKLKNNIQNINQESNKKINNWNDKRTQKITELSNETFETEKNQDLEEKIKKEQNLEENKEKQDPRPENSVQKLEKQDKFSQYTVKEQIKEVNEIDSKDVNIDQITESSKRLCTKTMDLLFLSLFEDLNCLYDWQAEENLLEKELELRKEKGFADKDNEDDGPDNKVSGQVWVLRGMLAERLDRPVLAERAYRKSLETGFNLYAWSRLIKLYMDLQSYKAVIICICEILEELQQEGVKFFDFYPVWIEEPLLEIISKVGVKRYNELLKENKVTDDLLVKIGREAEYWKIHNFDKI